MKNESAKKIYARVVLDIATLLAVFIFPWWLSVVVVLVLIFAYERYYEAIFYAVLIYELYAGASSSSGGAYTFPLITIGLLGIAEFTKRRLMLYRL